MSEELARRAVACKHWRWMPRMMDTAGRTFIEYADCGEAAWLWVADDGCEWLPVEGRLPDLSDPATLGCLLALVREAWGDPALSVTAGYTKDRTVEWEVEHPHPDSLPEALWTYFDTEAEALVAALEAAL